MKLLGYFRDLTTSDSQLFSETKGEVTDDHIALYSRDMPSPTEWQLRIVAAANRYGDVIVVSARHHDLLMNAQLKRLEEAGIITTVHTRDQGFIDNMGAYHSREDALAIAREAGQINQNRLKTTPFRQLFSEDLY